MDPFSVWVLPRDSIKTNLKAAQRDLFFHMLSVLSNL